ncbi:ATPase, partial [Bifidobacteriaceae bacterium NR003]
ADKGKKKKLIILIVGIVVLALALSALGAFWYVKQTERTKAARKQCEVKVAQVMKAKKTWDTLVKNRILIKLSEDKSENGKKLAKIIKETTPEVVSCTANSPEELGSQSAEALAASEWYAVKAKEIRSLAVELLNSADTKAEDKDKKEEKKEEKKEIQRTTSNVIRRANVIPQKTKPAPQNNNKKDPKKPECKGKDCKKPQPKCKPGDENCKEPQKECKPGDENCKEPQKECKPGDENCKKPQKECKPGDENCKKTNPPATNPPTTNPPTTNPPTTNPPTTN